MAAATLACLLVLGAAGGVIAWRYHNKFAPVAAGSWVELPNNGIELRLNSLRVADEAPPLYGDKPRLPVEGAVFVIADFSLRVVPGGVGPYTVTVELQGGPERVWAADTSSDTIYSILTAAKASGAEESGTVDFQVPASCLDEITGVAPASSDLGFAPGPLFAAPLQR
jgi:hypothetical protein